MTEDHKVHIEELTKIGALNIADLEINRSGHLALGQKRMLYFNFAFWLILTGFDLIILALFIYFLLVFQRNFITGIIGSCFIIVPAYMCITNAIPYWNDVQDDKPHTASGKIYKHFTIGRGIGKYQRVGYHSVRINNQIFSVSPAVYNYIIDEEIYRVYFVSNSSKLLNIEPL